eukprot:jgi/Ulvmu1/1578/UM111_0006.1
MFTSSVRAPSTARVSAVRPARVNRRVSAKAEGEKPSNPLEAVGDAVKETAQKFADAQKMPDLGEDDELTKDGAFYTVNNDNPLEESKGVRTSPNEPDNIAPSIPFGESGSKGSNPGSDSTKPSVADNVKEVVDKISGKD